MPLSQEGCLLRIFIGECDQKDKVPLYEWIIRRAKEAGIAGATVLRGIEGYGAHNDIHTAKILELSTHLPVIIELIDLDEKINPFISLLEEILAGGLMTQQKVTIKFFSKKEKQL